MGDRATFDLAQRLRTRDGAPIGEWALGEAPPSSIRFSPDGKSLALVAETVSVWSLDPGRWVRGACALAARIPVADGGASCG